MESVTRHLWLSAAVVAALVVAAVSAAWPMAWPMAGGPLGALTGAGPSEWAMLACGYCAGAAIFMVVSDTWVAFLSSPASWGKLAGCATACYTMLT